MSVNMKIVGHEALWPTDLLPATRNTATTVTTSTTTNTINTITFWHVYCHECLNISKLVVGDSI